MEAISELDANFSTGLDGKHPRLMKNLSAELSVPLTLLFKNYLVDGIGCLPRDRQTSLVLPLYKKSL